MGEVREDDLSFVRSEWCQTEPGQPQRVGADQPVWPAEAAAVMKWLGLAVLAVLAACSAADTVAGQPGTIMPRLDGRVVIMGGVSGVR